MPSDIENLAELIVEGRFPNSMGRDSASKSQGQIRIDTLSFTNLATKEA
ncbi:MAG: hypothetical protein BroJett030_09930 [Alphaproteobacteria bacterium]|nr:MAG: hypothetical protein BroJett030_09930 [Alphaproteobacteria bacterium]